MKLPRGWPGRHVRARTEERYKNDSVTDLDVAYADGYFSTVWRKRPAQRPKHRESAWYAA